MSLYYNIYILERPPGYTANRLLRGFMEAWRKQWLTPGRLVRPEPSWQTVEEGKQKTQRRGHARVDILCTSHQLTPPCQMSQGMS